MSQNLAGNEAQEQKGNSTSHSEIFRHNRAVAEERSEVQAINFANANATAAATPPMTTV